MDPSEVEFLAEKEEIDIVPNFSQDKIYLIGVSMTHFKFSYIIARVYIFRILNCFTSETLTIDWTYSRAYEFDFI